MDIYIEMEKDFITLFSKIIDYEFGNGISARR